MANRPLVAGALAAAASLLLAGSASAADPIPGATYEGTTDTGSPFSFVVSPDGRSITDVRTSAPLTCVGPEGGVEIFAIVTTVPIPVAGGAFEGTDSSTTPRVEPLKGTFTSASEARGTLQAGTSKFKIGEGVTSCMREVIWTARTSAAAPAAGSGPASTSTPAAAGGPGAATAPALSFTPRRGVKLQPSLTNGWIVGGTVAAPAKLTATATLAAKDARRYGLGRRAVVVDRAAATVAAAGPFLLELKPSKRIARKLRRARRLTFTVKIVAHGATGKPVATTRRMTLS